MNGKRPSLRARLYSVSLEDDAGDALVLQGVAQGEPYNAASADTSLMAGEKAEQTTNPTISTEESSSIMAALLLALPGPDNAKNVRLREPERDEITRPRHNGLAC